MSNLYSRLCAGVLGGLAGLVIACGPSSDDKQDASVPDANYPTDAGCNSNCSVDAGEPADGGYVNQVPIVVAEAMDYSNNIKTEFKAGEDVCLSVDKTKDFDCNARGSYCGRDGTGINYCDRRAEWNGGEIEHGINVPGGHRCLSFINLGQIKFTFHCYDLESSSLPREQWPFGLGEITINILN